MELDPLFGSQVCRLFRSCVRNLVVIYAGLGTVGGGGGADWFWGVCPSNCAFFL